MIICKTKLQTMLANDIAQVVEDVVVIVIVAILPETGGSGEICKTKIRNAL